LGGASTVGDPYTFLPAIWEWAVATFAARSVLDVGCGVGLALEWFAERGLTIHGIEGSHKVWQHNVVQDHVVVHDLYDGPYRLPRPVDLVWSCEVAEHIDPGHVCHFVDTIVENCGKVLILTAAPPGAGGHHHVNCQPREYWQSLVAPALVFRQDLTDLCCQLVSTDKGIYFHRGGMVFVRPDEATCRVD
jgi:SAM-dependent methyltransferase